jgi:hypothetical protein
MKLRASLLAALLGPSVGAKELCSISDLSEVTKGAWACQSKNGESLEIAPGQQVTPDTKCSVSCDPDHYTMRPGVANYVRCRDGEWVMRSTDREIIQMKPVTCHRKYFYT